MVAHFFKTFALMTFCLLEWLAAPLGPQASFRIPLPSTKPIFLLFEPRAISGRNWVRHCLYGQPAPEGWSLACPCCGPLAGTLFFTLIQAKDLALPSHFVAGLVEFHTCYLASGALVTAAFIVAARLTTNATHG
ncbi:MAG: hypothetical protein R3E56_15150 [Burkholderiaceae bacterium]